MNLQRLWLLWSADQRFPKLAVLERLSEICDQLVVGGGIANTFLAAAGYPVGKSLCEMDLIPTAKALMAKTQIRCPLMLCGKEFSDSAEATVKLAADVADDDMILDIGPYLRLAWLR